ncbi:unnamed protein product [Brassicogethes aeneus]|uniref:Bestrophin homolog n=1 Tax=Brassicogethes aeneus TaxID=1431903 RepID=A0A9P0FJV4_BRAAE|nr:unnamed protein product [Brassicogethes aeneus]
MTITYTSEVTTSKGISCFLKLLLRWKGSIYKIVWADLLIFLLIYYSLACSYVFCPDELYKEYFTKAVKYCREYGSMIPLSFVLGFYVSLVMTRWWSQYSTIPFPDNLAILVGAIIKGQNERARIVRRTVVRYACVSFTITLTLMSPKVKKRFPTLNHFVDAGLITKEEKQIMQELDTEYPSYSKYWLPLAWATSIVTRAKHEGLILDNETMVTIIEELNLFRTKCGGMLDYDWISVPLVYTQVVTLAVYSYFVTSVFSNQYIEGLDQNVLIYFPILPVLEFFFYMGWLKVAESLINPYGDDDDDFEVMWMIDRHVQVCYLLVDKIHQQHPKLMKDAYWAETAPNSLPYTIASQSYMNGGRTESTKNITVKANELDLLIPDSKDEVEGRYNRNSTALDSVRNLFGRKRVRGIPLKSVSHNTDRPERLQNIPDLNDYLESDITNPTKNYDNYSAEYEKLKKQRLEAHKQKILKYLELIKSKDSAEQEEILHSIN